VALRWWSWLRSNVACIAGLWSSYCLVRGLWAPSVGIGSTVRLHLRWFHGLSGRENDLIGMTIFGNTKVGFVKFCKISFSIYLLKSIR
jgi:hypothetical protein